MTNRFCIIGTHSCIFIAVLVVYKAWVDIINNIVITIILLANVLLRLDGYVSVCSV